MSSCIYFAFFAVLFSLGEARYCEENPNPCLNGGSCLNVGFTYRCQCPPSCSGSGGHCESCISGPCTPNPCKRDCSCHESCQHAGGYYCRSASGFLGKNCTVPIPTLRCEVDRIVFSVSESFLREYDMGLRNSFITVTQRLQSSNKCEISRSGNGVHEIQIPLPFTACGTQVLSDDGSLVFTNQMWFNRRLTNSMFDMPIPVATFRCQYERRYSVVTSLRPVVSTPTTITGRNFITPSISLCKAPVCPSVCPDNLSVNGGAVYTIGEMIHVSMSLDSGSGVTGVQHMFLSCSRTPVTTNTIPIVTNGCGAISGLPSKITTSASTYAVCVSFQTPRSLSCQEFFIHAKLESCAREDVTVCTGTPSTSKCSASRRKRSAESSSVVVGPIVLLLNGSAGLPTVEINGMEDVDDDQAVPVYKVATQRRLLREEAPVPDSTVIAVPIIVVAVVAAVLLVSSLVLIWFVRSRFSSK